MQPGLHQQYPQAVEKKQFISGFLASIPGQNDLQILENLKEIIKNGQHEFYRPVPQPAALASIYLGPSNSAGQASTERQHQQPPLSSSDVDIPGPSVSDAESGLDVGRPLKTQWEESTDQGINANHENSTPRVDPSLSNGKPVMDLLKRNAPNATELPPKPLSSLQTARAEHGEAVLKPNDFARDRDRASSLSLRDAPPLVDDRRRFDTRGYIDDNSRYGHAPSKDQRIYDRDRERERERERDFRPRDDRRPILRPPPEDRHYEPAYDRPPRRIDDKLPNELYPPSSLHPYDNAPELRPRPLNPDRHYRPDEQLPSAPVHTSDRYYRPDDRFYPTSNGRDHAFHADPPNVRVEYRPKSPDLHPIIGVSKVAEMAAANRKAQIARGSPEERTPKPSLIERLNPPPSLQERISDAPAANKPPSDDRAVNPASLEERLAPRETSVAPQPRPDERTMPRPANDSTSAASRSTQGERSRNGSVDGSNSTTQPATERTQAEEDLSRALPADRPLPLSTSTRPSTYVRDISPSRSYRPGADLREAKASNSYRPDTEKGVYERPEYTNGDRYDSHHAYVKRPGSPGSDRDRGRPIIPPAGAPIRSTSHDAPASYSRRPSPPRDRRDWEAYPASYPDERNWRPDTDYRRPPYDSRAALLPSDKERYDREAARAAGWETRDERHNSYRPKSRGAYDTYPPLPGPLPDSRTSYPPVPRDERRFVGNDASRIRPRSPSPDIRRRTVVDDLRPPAKRVRDDAYPAPTSYYPVGRPSNYVPPPSAPGGGSYYPPGEGRGYSREYPPDYDRRSPPPGSTRMPDYATRTYVPRDDRRYAAPPPRTS